jgi:hypothetical protein
MAGYEDRMVSMHMQSGSLQPSETEILCCLLDPGLSKYHQHASRSTEQSRRRRGGLANSYCTAQKAVDASLEHLAADTMIQSLSCTVPLLIRVTFPKEYALVCQWL